MNFKPSIHISKFDLDKLSSEFENDSEWNNDTDLQRVIDLVKRHNWNHKGLTLYSSKFIRENIDFSVFNKKVREKLDKLGIVHKVENN